jgi:hypothetical protein
MEAMLGISLYIYPYLNYQKRFALLLFILFLQEREKGRTDSAWKWGGWGEWPKNVCTYE